MEPIESFKKLNFSIGYASVAFLISVLAYTGRVPESVHIRSKFRDLGTIKQVSDRT